MGMGVNSPGHHGGPHLFLLVWKGVIPQFFVPMGRIGSPTLRSSNFDLQELYDTGRILHFGARHRLPRVTLKPLFTIASTLSLHSIAPTAITSALGAR